MEKTYQYFNKTVLVRGVAVFVVLLILLAGLEKSYGFYSDFCDGYLNGYEAGYFDDYEEGYCYNSTDCVGPTRPICPTQKVGELDYGDGFDRGFIEGMRAKMNRGY